MQEVAEGVRRIFHHVMQETCCPFLICVSHETHSERMQYHRIAIPVHLALMRLGGNL